MRAGMTADWLPALGNAIREGVRLAVLEYGHQRRVRSARRHAPSNVTPIRDGIFTEGD